MRGVSIKAPAVTRPTTPCRTIPDAVQQARSAFRQFREDIKEGKVTKANPEHPYCCRIQIPLPHPDDDDTIRILDDGEFPGGVRQKFRQLRPKVEDTLFGCSPFTLPKAAATRACTVQHD